MCARRQVKKPLRYLRFNYRIPMPPKHKHISQKRKLSLIKRKLLELRPSDFKSSALPLSTSWFYPLPCNHWGQTTQNLFQSPSQKVRTHLRYRQKNSFIITSSCCSLDWLPFPGTRGYPENYRKHRLNAPKICKISNEWGNRHSRSVVHYIAE